MPVAGLTPLVSYGVDLRASIGFTIHDRVREAFTLSSKSLDDPGILNLRIRLETINQALEKAGAILRTQTQHF